MCLIFPNVLLVFLNFLFDTVRFLLLPFFIRIFVFDTNVGRIRNLHNLRLKVTRNKDIIVAYIIDIPFCIKNVPSRKDIAALREIQVERMVLTNYFTCTSFYSANRSQANDLSHHPTPCLVKEDIFFYLKTQY